MSGIDQQSVFGSGGSREAIRRLEDGAEKIHRQELARSEKIQALANQEADSETDRAPDDQELTNVFGELDQLVHELERTTDCDLSLDGSTSRRCQGPLAGLYATHSTPSAINGIGVNAKRQGKRRPLAKLSTVGRARVMVSLATGSQKRVAAIGDLDPDRDHLAISQILKVDSFVKELARSYLTSGKLPDWSKGLSKDLKQFLRLRQILSHEDSYAMTIRLGHDVAEAALRAPRGPADYLAALIRRQLTALGIEAELVFNLEFIHGTCRGNHPMHIHGALRIPETRIDQVTEALRKALASTYRARWKNAAVKLEKPQQGDFWPCYCVKESGITLEILTRYGFRAASPSYSTRSQTQKAREFYNQIDTWLSPEPV